MDERLRKLIDKIERKGCDCDVICGYLCGIHEPLSELIDLLEEMLKDKI